MEIIGAIQTAGSQVSNTSLSNPLFPVPTLPVPQSLSPSVPGQRDPNHGEHKFPPLRGVIP